MTNLDDGALTDDAFLGGGLSILQPAKGYRAGIDAVLLAAAAPLGDGPARVLDAGAGVGTAGLCLARRCANASIVLLERDPLLARLAEENARRNELSDRVSVIEGDLGRVVDLAPETFDIVMANPPYHRADAGTPSKSPIKAASHAMEDGSLDSWCRFLARMAKPGGSVTVIHTAEALSELLAALRGRFGGLRVLPVHPRAAEPAIRIIAVGIKGSRAPLSLLPPFILHEDSHAFTAAAQAVLRHGAALAYKA